MKNNIFLLAGTLAFSLWSCSGPRESQEYKSLQQQKDSLHNVVQSKDKQLEDVANAVTEIENNLAAIEKSESAIGELRKEGQVNQKEKINAMISSIDSYMEQNKAKLDSLEQKANSATKAGKKQAVGLQKIIAGLRKQLKTKDAQVNELRQSLTVLNQENSSLKQTVSERERSLTERDSMLTDRQSTIDNQDTRIHTAYWVIGTRRELVDKGVVKREGGVLGLGKTSVLNTKLDNSKFTQINYKMIEEIDLGQIDKRMVVSSHPTESYYFTKSGNGRAQLKIVDKDKFWSQSKYLVLQTK